jgi:glutamate synthase (NADPH/NADH) small chain
MLVYTHEADGKLEVLQGSEFVIDCESVIKATGQEKWFKLLSTVEGLQLDAKQRIIVDENGQTGNTKYFAAGDAVNGGAEVVNAVAGGKAVGRGIDRRLKELD